MLYKHFLAISAAFFVIYSLLTSSWFGRSVALAGNLYSFSGQTYAMAGLLFLIAYSYACRWPIAGLISLVAVTTGTVLFVGLAMLVLPDYKIYSVDALTFTGWGAWCTYVTTSQIIPNLKMKTKAMPLWSLILGTIVGLFAILGAVALLLSLVSDVLLETGIFIAMIYAACLLWGTAVALFSRRHMSLRPWN